MEIIYQDADIVVAIKPPRVLSTDEPGGMPELLRQALGYENIRSVHRLDRVVSGLMVVARNAAAASDLSRQIREEQFRKEYLAVIHGVPEEKSGDLHDLLIRDKARKMTLVTKEMAKGVQPAALRYRVISSHNGMSRVRIQLETGRTHQIRVSMAEIGCPLLGDGKYGRGEVNKRYHETRQALYSYKLHFDFPTDAGMLNYLRGKTFTVDDVPFREKYFSEDKKG